MLTFFRLKEVQYSLLVVPQPMLTKQHRENICTNLNLPICRDLGGHTVHVKEMLTHK